MEQEVNITYETLFEILRREKNREELQKLTSTFFSDVVNYLSAKTELLNNKRREGGSPDEERRLLLQLDNTTKILRELYERREKKILLMAMNRARSGTQNLDSSNLLDEEQALYNELIEVLSKHRSGILASILAGKLPAKDKKEQSEMQTLRFLQPVPKFVGEELETYGPFAAEDIASLPRQIASVLVAKGTAEEIKSNNL